MVKIDGRKLFNYACLICLAALHACTGPEPGTTDRWHAAIAALKPLYPLKKALQPGDWLETHKEYYQSFDAYRYSNPYRPDSLHRTIYIVITDSFSLAEEGIINKTMACLAASYQLPVKRIRPQLPADRYLHGRYLHTKKQQLLAPYYNDTLLKSVMPADAAMLLGFTHEDLYPADGWNYVFGEASPGNRTGIWSIHRFGDPGTDFNACLMHTIKTALHEVGHLFSLGHCTRYECCMNGSNNLSEAARNPVYFCPDCLAKLCWNLRQDVRTKLVSMRNYWQHENDTALVQLYDAGIRALQ